MEQQVTKLVDDFEHGKLSRRGLIKGLTAIAAAGSAARASAQTTPFTATGIDHISVQVETLGPSIEFYQNIFGLSILNQDEANKIVRMGPNTGGGGPFGGPVIVSLHEKPPTGIVDHFAIAIRNFDQAEVTAALAEHGLEAENNLDYGFYVRDPAGMPVQIVASR
jgi:catechol 2,3-dioxygenase-like lactoylglutathione lyase family enzyme